MFFKVRGSHTTGQKYLRKPPKKYCNTPKDTTVKNTHTSFLIISYGSWVLFLGFIMVTSCPLTINRQLLLPEWLLLLPISIFLGILPLTQSLLMKKIMNQEWIKNEKGGMLCVAYLHCFCEYVVCSSPLCLCLNWSLWQNSYSLYFCQSKFHSYHKL